MKHGKAAIAGLAIGFMALVPVAASASTVTPTPGHGSPGPTTVSLSPHNGGPGTKVTITVTCDGQSTLITRAMTVVKDGSHRNGYIGTVNSVDMGVYEVKEQCHHREGNYDTFASDYFGVAPAQVVTTTPPPTTTPPVKTSPVKTPPSKAPAAKQVAKVPVGAPSTGGGGMAGDLG